MERLVREELERWDSDSNIDSGAGGGSGSATQRASPSAGSGGRGPRSSNPSQNVSSAASRASPQCLIYR